MHRHSLTLLKPLHSTSSAHVYVAQISGEQSAPNSHAERDLVRLIQWSVPSNATHRLQSTLNGIRLASHPSILAFDFVDPDSQYPDSIATATRFCHQSPFVIAQDQQLDAFCQLAQALAASHRMGICHGSLTTQHIYALHADSVVAPAIDLLDGLLKESSLAANTDDSAFDGNRAMTMAVDIRSLAEVFQSWLADCVMDSELHRRVAPLLQAMLAADWSDRPSAFEVAEQLVALQDRTDSSQHTSGFQSSAALDDATQEIPAAVASELVRKNLVSSDIARLGRFVIERTLGEGGMGSVYLGRDETNDQFVAIKVLTQQLSKDEKASRRFAKEARLLSTLVHPAIARLIEFNRYDDKMYLAMEYVPGGTLAHFTSMRRQYDERLAIAAVADAARGLALAHQNGMVHRDIKPANLLLTHYGENAFQANQWTSAMDSQPMVKVADFGLAKHFDAQESLAMTQTGMVLGTPLYMSPEQCRSEEVGPASDVYSLGITLYQLLAGQLPFEGQSAVEIFRMHCDAPIPSVRSVVGTVSDAVDGLIQTCLAKNPQARFRGAAELADELEAILLGKPKSIALHPDVPNRHASGILRYQYQWKMRSSAKALWPYVSNTDRVNHAIGLPAVRYRTFQDPKLGMRRMAMVKAMGMNMEWEEHPYEWVEGQRLSVLRQFPSGPFHWFTNVVELVPQSDGGTLIVQTLEMLPRNLAGKLFARFQIGNKSERNFGKVYEKIDQSLLSNDSASAGTNAFAPSKGITRQQKSRLGERFGRMRASNERLEPKVLDLLEQFLEFASDLDVARIRPVALAGRWGVKSDDLVHACLLAAREGALILLWDILCPTCRIPSSVQETLRGLADHGHCEACNADFELDFAQSIELIFRAHPEVRTCETKTYCVGGPAFSSHVVAQVRLQPDERLVLQLRMNEGEYRLRGPQLPYVVDFRVTHNSRVGRWDFDLSRPIARQDAPVLRYGEQVIALFNANIDPIQVRIERLASKADALTAAEAARIPAFRAYFPDEVLSPGQMLSLTTVTLYGCKLANAAKIYSEHSDQAGSATILKHLQNMADIIRDHSGCVIKSTNDGLIAVFPNAFRAAQCAGAMVHQSVQWNVQLQQAFHSGPAIVATINDRLDYFGQTPQTLSDLLSQCGPGELWLTESCWSESEVANELEIRWEIELASVYTSFEKQRPLRAIPKLEMK